MGKLMFVRQNIVEAIPMTRREYVESRGWTLPENENPDEMVYKVIYEDGYVSMCPKDKFDARSIECGETTVPFGYAIAECQYHGKRIARVGWNGEGQYVVYQDCATLFPLTEEQKKEASPEPMLEATSSCFVFHFVNRKTGETGIQVGWLASQADMKAKDWIVLD